MSDTPRTDAAQTIWNDIGMMVVLSSFARQLERELAAAKDGWRDEICKAQADMRRAETMLNDERKHRAEAQADYRCLAELLDGHDATECRANLVKLQADLAAERALADRLAGELQWWGDYCGDNAPASIDLALAAWKEARSE